MKLHEIVKIVTQEVPGVDLSKFSFKTLKENYLDLYTIELGINGDLYAFKVILNEDKMSVAFIICDEITDLHLSKKVLMIKRTWCNKKYRRRGIISNLYRFIYNEYGCSIMSDIEQSPESIALWDKLRDSWNVKMIDMNTKIISNINSTELYHDTSKALIIESFGKKDFEIIKDYRFCIDEN